MKTFAPSRVCLALALVLGSTGAMAATPTLAEQQKQIAVQQQQINALTQQLMAMQAKLAELASQNEALAAQQERQSAPVAVAATTASASASVSATPAPTGVASASNTAAANAVASGDKLHLWGYGEAVFLRPSDDHSQTTADIARAVVGLGYRFNDKTRFNSEFEIEHGVSSSDDAGEVEVEQFYVERDLNEFATLQAGLFLIPSGYTNLSHEPTNYYGVQRNFVETLIIPSTWREGGVSLHGDTELGLNWNLGLTTGFNLSGWEFNPEAPLYATAEELLGGDAGPLRATHQELSEANAEHLSQYLALNYNGVPGYNLGGSYFTGKAVPVDPSLSDPRVTLWEVHTRWTPGDWDLSALYARGTFSNTDEANELFPGATNPIPAAFYGYYGQVAYNVWEEGDYRLSPFARYERYDLGDDYDGLAPGATPVPTTPIPGFAPWPQQNDTVWTYGANFYVTPNVVFKADYQRFDENDGFDRFDLGMGVAF